MGKIIFGEHGSIKAKETVNGDWIVYDSKPKNQPEPIRTNYSSTPDYTFDPYSGIKVAIFGTLLGVFATIGLITTIVVILCLIL